MGTHRCSHAHASISRRRFLRAGSATAAIAALAPRLPAAWSSAISAPAPLDQFSYSDVSLASDLHESQLMNTHSVLMNLSEDSLLKPFRQMAGLPAPGDDLGGWYNYNPAYDYRTGFDDGFAPACTFGQWVSALARVYAITGEQATRDKILRLNRLYAETIGPDFYIKSRFPAYTYDKLLIGLLDSHTYAHDPQALAILEHTTDTALPHLPGHAIEHDHIWRTDKDPSDASWTWDESYTMPENLFLASARGAGRRYYDLGLQYLLDRPWFDPLSRNENVLHGHHAYSYVNSLSSAMMAYMVAGSEKHLRAAQNAFAMLAAQSYATGGWGPDEQLRAPGSPDLFDSLTNTHHNFETPCGSYAHFKLTRYLLRVTRDSRYGDSMERTMFNTVLGALPLQENGKNFYYSDYNFNAERVYKEARWACCSGTLPQVAADYRINTYFRAPSAVYVNLYIPSTLRWTEGAAQVSLTLETDYPYEHQLSFTVSSSQPAEFTLSFRIPAWAQGAEIHVNDTRQNGVPPGQFASIRRTWRTGDRIDLEFPLHTSLEPIDPQHPETVALLRGPLVLMPVKASPDATLRRFTRDQLLKPRRISEREWQVDSSAGRVTMLPFTSLGSRPYSTYGKLT